MAAQLFETARAKAPDVAPALAQGEIAPLADWLRENVWRHGRRYERDEILTRATGRKLDPAPYLRHLAARYAG
jgi:carboxypeptidase Taq